MIASACLRAAKTMMRRDTRQLLALFLFALLSLVWLSPVTSDLDIPGSGAGDNFTFVWNGWWMREALTTHVSPFHTPMLFAPWGVDLALNTHTALPAAFAALLSRRMSILAATNYVVALHLYLNFVIAFALAHRVTRQMAAAILAALIFGWSPYIGAHLAGHFNLIAAWVLPLVALLLIDALEIGTVASRVLLGIALGITVYVDYYYAVYATALVACLTLARSISFQPMPRVRGRGEIITLRALGGVGAVGALLIVFVAVTGGTVISFGGGRISMRGVDNLVAAAGLLALIAAMVAWLPSVRVGVARQSLAVDARRLVVPLALALLVASPVVAAGLSLWRHGDYVTQRYLWRSAPPGVDVGTALLGNPVGLLWGRLPASLYAALHIDLVEQIAWFGPAVTALAVIAIASAQNVPSWRANDAVPADDPGPVEGSDSSGTTCPRKVRKRGQTPIHTTAAQSGVRPQVRAWTAAGAVFLIWALGPFLVAFGRHVHVLLPATLVRFMPIVSNARIPGRAIVVVYLAAAVLAACGFAALRQRGRATLAWLLFAAVVLDYAPRTAQVFHVERPSIYDVLRTHPAPGGVCELPLGLRDGFGERGRFDSRVLFYQTIHQRPIAGGFVARLPPRIVAAYDADRILGPLLRLSEGQPLASERTLEPSEGSDALIAHGFRFVVIDRELAPRDLLTFTDRALKLREIARDGNRVLYEVAPGVNGG